MTRMLWIGGFGFALWPKWGAKMGWKPGPRRWNAVKMIQLGPLLLARATETLPDRFS